MSIALFRSFLFFLNNTLGCINNPYSTYRRLALKTSHHGHGVFIFLLMISYFAFASAVRSGIRNPYLLTVQFNSLLFAAAVGFIGMTLLLWCVGRMFRTVVPISTIVVLWSYSYLPTILWFFATSVLFVLLPPPRTLSVWGTSYSVVFVTFSLGMLGWKIILYYLTIRFGLRFDFARIVLASLVVSPVVAGYSVAMYRLGIMRIPFL